MLVNKLRKDSVWDRQVNICCRQFWWELKSKWSTTDFEGPTTAVISDVASGIIARYQASHLHLITSKLFIHILASPD